MSIDCSAVPTHIVEQMRRVWRRDALRREMAPDVEISGIFLLLDTLMVRARFFQCVLLSADFFGKRAITRIELATHFVDIFFDDGDFRFSGDQLFLGHAQGIGAARWRANKLGAFSWLAYATHSAPWHSRVYTRQRRLGRSTF